MTEPPALKRRPHHGNFPVPFVTAVIDGVPDFKVHDLGLRARVAAEKLCQLCGEPHSQEIAFVGSDRSIADRTFGEPPAHVECLHYAFEVCPWLAGKPYAIKRPNGTVWLDPPAKPPHEMGVLITDRFWLIEDDEGLTDCKFKTGEPIREIEWRTRA